MARPLLYEDHRCTVLGGLITFARVRQTTSYTDFVATTRLPLNIRDNPVHRNLLSQWLFEIAREEDAAGRPLLPALVVRSGSGLPGPGFFAMLEALGQDRPGESETDAHARVLNEVFNYYDDKPQLIPCWVEPARDRDRAVIETSRAPWFGLQPVRYPHVNPQFLLVHSEASAPGRSGKYVTPQWLTGGWPIWPSIWAYRFLLSGDPVSWRLLSADPDWSGRRVLVTLAAEDGRVVDVRKVREYGDGSIAFEVLYSDNATTWGKVRRENGVFRFFEVDHHRPGWPEPPFDMIEKAYNSVIPG